MKSKNPSVLNQEVQKYVNGIIKEVYRISAHSINFFGSDLSTTASTNGSKHVEDSIVKSKFSYRSIVNGIPYSLISLMKNYLKNFKQSSIERLYRMPLDAKTVVGTTTVAYPTMTTVLLEGHSTLTIPVPDGFDGNASYIKVMLDGLANDPDTTVADHDKLIGILESITTPTYHTGDAVMFFVPDLHQGSFGIEVAKSTKSILITINSSGLTGDYKSIPDLLVRVIYFKRGAK